MTKKEKEKIKTVLQALSRKLKEIEWAIKGLLASL